MKVYILMDAATNDETGKHPHGDVLDVFSDRILAERAQNRLLKKFKLDDSYREEFCILEKEVRSA